MSSVVGAESGTPLPCISAAKSSGRANRYQSRPTFDEGVLEPYDEQIVNPKAAPPHWAPACTDRELTLHQLSPYIGKLKSVIARDLVEQYTTPGQLVVDPFCGSGTVSLEAACLGRRVFASDASSYAITLTRAKLGPPASEETALCYVDRLGCKIAALPDPDLRAVPPWVRRFFHAKTLAETIKIANFLKSRSQHFYLAALLGILHHQRPGFLSYPSSALVPYLRTRKFPPDKYPDMYAYRPVIPRLRAKVSRAFKRPPAHSPSHFVEASRRSFVHNVTLPPAIDCVITSPPYMNALDYIRDNRLRLWLLDEPHSESQERTNSTLRGFRASMLNLASKIERRTKKGAHCIFVVGERVARSRPCYPSRELARAFLTNAPSFQLQEIMRDHIPDIRRARRARTGVKVEHFLVFRRVR